MKGAETIANVYPGNAIDKEGKDYSDKGEKCINQEGIENIFL